MTFIILLEIPFRVTSEENRIGIGAVLDGSYNTSEFKGLPGIPNCCPRFSSGFGFGYGLMGYYEHRLAGSIFLNLGLSYITSSNEIFANEATVVSYNQQAIDGEFEHYLKLDMDVISFSPGITYRIADNMSLGIFFPLGYTTNKSYEQRETIVKPSDAGTFLDSNGFDTGKRTRNEFSGSLPLPNQFYSNINAAFRIDLPMNTDRSIFISPSLGISYSITKALNNLNLRTGKLSLSIVLTLLPGRLFSVEEFEITPNPLSIEKEADVPVILAESLDKNNPKNEFYSQTLTASENLTENAYEFEMTFDTTYIERVEIEREIRKRRDTISQTLTGSQSLTEKSKVMINLKESGGKKIEYFKAEEYATNHWYPMLNYIFFEKNSAVIHERYFNSQTLTGNQSLTAMDYYYDILNIVGRKLKYNAESKLKLKTVTGADDASFNPAARAKAIKDFLVNNYSIEPERIEVETKPVSQKMLSDVKSEKLSDEYRRVEMETEYGGILEPISYQDTSIYFDPPQANFIAYVDGNPSIKDWSVTLENDDRIYKKIIGSKERVPDKLTWNLNNSRLRGLDLKKGIDYKLTVRDSLGNEVSDEGRFDIAYTDLKSKETAVNKEGIYQTEKYYLILFDFNSSELSDESSKMIEVINSTLADGDEVSVYGYSDQTGNRQYNMELSKQRAKAVTDALGVPVKEARGFGSRNPLYSNEIPEGRYYSRAVEIFVKGK